MTYRYKFDKPGEIRIFDLDPGSADDTITGKIRSESYTTGFFPHYEALSYCWGLDIKDHTIETPEGEIPITTSLSRALRAIRSPAQKRTLWVDAVCIDQSSAAEKEAWIPAMGQIYRRAHSVIVYLGDEQHDSAEGLEILESLSACCALTFGPAESSAPVDERILRTLRLAFNIAHRPDTLQLASKIAHRRDINWAPARAIFARPWFSRVWIVQEFLHGTEVIIQCGSWTGPWFNLWLGTMIGYPMAPYGQTGSILPQPETVLDDAADIFRWEAPVDAGSEMLSFQRGINLFRTLGLEKMTRTATEALGGIGSSSDEDYDNQLTSRLFLTLSMMRGRDCKDPRDTIYAYLSLLHPQESLPLRTNPFPISYTKSAMEIAGEYGELMLRSRVGLNLLYSAGLSQQKQPPTDWPSWVPDWTTESPPDHHKFHCSLAAEKSRYNASASLELSSSLDRNNGMLVLKGAVVKKVRQVGAIYAESAHPNVAMAIAHFILEALNFVEEIAEDEADSHEILDDVLWRVVIGDCTKDGDEPPKSYADLFKICVAKILGIPTKLSDLGSEAERRVEEKMETYLSRVRHCVVDRVLCVTEDGCLGLVPKQTTAGDLIGILAGGKVPVMLRNINSLSDERGPFWIVGEAYIHGMMAGEGVAREGFNIGELAIR